MSQAGTTLAEQGWTQGAAQPRVAPWLKSLSLWLLLCCVALLVAAPIAAIVFGAFRTQAPGDPRAAFTLHKIAGIYGGLFSGSWTQTATLHTLMIAVPVTVFATGLGLLLAWAVTRTDMPGRRFMELAFLLPLLYSPLVGVIGWTVLADPRAGLVNQAWSAMIGHRSTLIDVYSYTGITWVMIFYFAPYAFLLSSGGFRALDTTLEEAATVAGANLFRRMTQITLPVMLPGIAASALFIFTLALEQFAIPGFLGAHVRFDTLAYSIYLRTNAYPIDLPGAAAAGTLLLLLASVGLFAYRRLTRHSARFVAVTARGYRPGTTELGAGRFVLLGICCVLLLLGVIVPLLAVLFRALLPVRTPQIDLHLLTLNNFVQLGQAEDIVLGLKNTMYLAVGAATICAVLGLLLGYRVTRAKSLGIAAIDYMVALPIGIPGTVFGVGMLWAFVRTPLYLTLWILLLAFVIRYLVYSVRTIGGAIMQIDPTLEESAAIAGGSPLRSFLFVDLPLLRPVLASAWLLVFLIVMREISASIILYGADTVTLPILTWSYLNDGSYGIASALAIVQIVIVGAVVVLARMLFGADIRSRSSE